MLLLSILMSATCGYVFLLTFPKIRDTNDSELHRIALLLKTAGFLIMIAIILSFSFAWEPMINSYPTIKKKCQEMTENVNQYEVISRYKNADRDFIRPASKEDIERAVKYIMSSYYIAVIGFLSILLAGFSFIFSGIKLARGKKEELTITRVLGISISVLVFLLAMNLIILIDYVGRFAIP
jgi:hypothetical protein